MHTVEFLPGTHIANAANELVKAADEHGAARGVFNGIEMTAERSASPAAIVDTFHREQARRLDEYRQSPEHKEAERQANQRRSEAQQTHDTLMARLPTLDMGNDVAVLDWLCQMQEPSDHVGVIVRKQTIIDAFEKAGFRANANCGAAYKPGDRQNMHRYLVGQALAGLKEGPAIHPIIHKFANEWRQQFAEA